MPEVKTVDVTGFVVVFLVASVALSLFNIFVTLACYSALTK